MKHSIEFLENEAMWIRKVPSVTKKSETEENNCSVDDSVAYLNKLKKEKRYLRDVY